jgi:hypothetical protein
MRFGLQKQSFLRPITALRCFVGTGAIEASAGLVRAITRSGLVAGLEDNRGKEGTRRGQGGLAPYPCTRCARVAGLAQVAGNGKADENRLPLT